MNFNASYGYRALPPGPRTILFVSEPLEGSSENPYDGYNEKRILDHVIYAAESILKDKHTEPWTIIVAVHEGQYEEGFNYLQYWSGGTKIVISTKKVADILPVADLVIGMDSEGLALAIEQHKPVISVQPRLTRPDAFTPNAMGASYAVYRIIDLTEAVEEVMYSTKIRSNMYGGCMELVGS